MRGQPYPLRHALARQVHPMAAPVDLFLPVQRKVVAVFAYKDLRQQPWRGDATLLELLRQRRDDWRVLALPAMHVLSPDQPPPNESGRLVVELLADFLSYA